MCCFRVKYGFLLLCLMSLVTNCSAPPQNSSNLLPLKGSPTLVSTKSERKVLPNTFGYNLEQPTSKFKLPTELKEISGLACYKDQYLAAVQDEKGAIYLLDIQTGDIKDVIAFSADGDYEGIACVNHAFYVLRADGVLFQVRHWEKPKKAVKTKVINTNLGELNNTEGLAYHSKKQQLLIACKGSALIGEEEHAVRAVYAYDLKKDKFNTKPILQLERKPFKAFIKEHLEQDPYFKAYKKDIKKAKKRMLLEPSAIAIHPITQHIYILSAVGNSLMVLDKSYQIKYLKRLPKDRFEQPEGLTFNSKGDLFLSSEGVKKKARIYKFDYLH